MKATTGFLMLGLCLATFSGSADSIKAAGVLHKDVYILTKPQYYLVHFPEEGRVEKISRARRDVEEPKIDTDATAREALRARYETRRAEIEGALKAVPDEAVELDTEAYFRKQALIEGAVFETQFEHWRKLSDAQQTGILREILNLSASKAAQWEGEQSTISGRLVELDAAKASRKTELAKAGEKRDVAIDEAERYNSSDLYLRLHERELVEYERGNSDYASDYWLKGADTELALEERRKAAANQAYAKEAGVQKAALSAVEGAITQQERDAQAVENKGIDASRRYGAYLDRIDGLILASQAGYVPGLDFKTMESWERDDDLRTPAVTITSPVWRLTCLRDDFAVSGSLAITVYDAETDAPFTRIGDKDFLGMRSKVFERAGSFYFVVEQDSTRIPYTLMVSEVLQAQGE